MCFKMLLPYIVMEISLVALSKAKGGINPEEENKLFVQYKDSSAASGWYTKLNVDLYMRDKNFSSDKYVFQRSNNVWMLLAYPRNASIYDGDLINSTEKNMTSLIQVNFTNYKHTIEYRYPLFRFHSDERTTLRSLVRTKNKQKHRKRERSLNGRFQHYSEEELSEEQGLYEPINPIYEHYKTEDVFKIYLPNKCSCTKLEIRFNGIPFREYYRSDINKNLSDYCNQGYSIENRNLSSNNKNNNSLFDRRLEEWEEEAYFSDSCQQIYFDKDDDKWVAELTNYCSAYEKGIYSMIWSEDSAPCIEYLPPPQRQTWLYYSRLTVFDNPEVLETLELENCGVFKKSVYKEFSVICASITDGLT